MMTKIKFFLITLGLAMAFLLANCNDEPRTCEQADYFGEYVGSKVGILCQNDDNNYTFSVSAGAADDEILVDGNVMQFNGCDIFSPSTTLGLGREYDGYLKGDSIVVIETAGTGPLSGRCTWRGLRQ